MARTRRSSKNDNPIAPGAIGAAAGAVIGGATGVLMGSEKARAKLKQGLQTVSEYAQETISSIDTNQINRRLAKVGMKGGKSKTRSSQRPKGKMKH